MYNLGLDGAPSLFRTFPALEITWHKTEHEIYCHHAHLIFKSTLAFDTVRVEIKTITITSPSTKQKCVQESIITRYLPYLREEDKIIVPLNSTKLVDAIGLCNFTKNTNGQKCTLVRYPVSISFFYADEGQTCTFKNDLPPRLISKALLDSTGVGDKVTVLVNLKE